MFEVGGVSFLFKFKTKHPVIQQRVKEQYRHYFCNKKPDIFVEIECRSSVKKPNFKKLLIDASAWKLWEKDTHYLLYFTKERGISFAEINSAFNRVKFYTEDPSGQLLLYLLPEVLLGVVLPQKNAMIVHACGVLANRKAYFFVAPSGGGKSTIAKLALREGFSVLNDDRIIIRKEDNLFKIDGNPWHGELKDSSNISLYVKNVFFLNKARSNKIRYMSKREAVLGFLKNSLYLPINNDIFNKGFGICCDLAKALNCYWMDFRADKTIWRFLDEFFKNDT
ncbi:MAG: hypothetical protein ABIH40_06850 [Candidatus Omnitrophota bacterium]